MRSRTMIYLDPEDLRALQAEARVRGISLAELVRRVVQEHLDQRQRVAPPELATYLKIIGLGSSGRRDISERHDAYLGDALRREHAR